MMKAITLTSTTSERPTNESLGVFIAGLALLFFEVGPYWAWHYWNKWALVVGIFSLAFSWKIAKRTSLWFMPILSISLVSAASVSVWGPNRYVTFWDQVHPLDATPPPALMQFAIHNGALYTYLTVVMAALALVWLPKAAKSGVTSLLAFVAFASSVCTLTQLGLPAQTRGAFSGNPSMNGCLIATLLPFLFEMKTHRYVRVALAGLGLAAILATQSSVPIGVAAVVLISYCASRCRVTTSTVALASLGCVGLLLAGAWVSRDAFFSSSGRFETWAVFFHWLDLNSLWWTGTGLGSASTIMPYVQTLMKADQGGWFIFMHSEPLQILFEMGIPGLIAAILAFAWTACRAFRHPVLFASLMGIAAESLFDYPLRLPISCVSAVLTVWLILQEGAEDVRYS